MISYLKNLKIGTKIISGYVVLIVLLIITAAILLYNLRGLTSEFDFLVHHDQPVLANAAELQKLMVDMETGLRGFLITGDETFLEPYNAAQDVFDGLIETQKELVSDNPPQVALLEEIEQLHLDWEENVAEPEMALRYEANKASVSAETLQETVGSGVGKALMDRMRGLAAEIKNDLSNSSSEDLRTELLVDDVLKDMLDQETALRGFLVAGEDQFLDPLREGQARLPQNIAALKERLAADSQNLAKVDQIEALAEEWQTTVATPQIAARQEMNRNPVTITDVAMLVASGAGKERLDQIRAKFNTFTQVENDLNKQRSEEADQTALMAQYLTLVLMIGSTIIGLTIGVVISKNITVPLGKVVTAAQRVIEGDLSQRVAVTSTDETGVLANAFNRMTDDLQTRLEQEAEMRKIEQEANKNAVAKETIEQTVNEYNQFIQQVAQGDLTARLAVNGSNDDLTLLGHNLNTMVESLSDITRQIREATNNISSAAAEILAATTQQASGANEQSSAISQTTTTIDEVKTIVEQAFSKAQSVADQARRTSSISQDGKQAVSETVDSMSQIKERVEGIAENILALSEQTQQIGEITATVNEIASQSNLLALNASVEAARAGEHGKGFAVVAVEVRNLAEQSKQATAQVKAILNEIQRATNAAVMATEEGTKGVESGAQLTEQTGDTINQLAGSIQESANAAEQIVASAQQQTTGMEQIALAMQNINQATVQNLASTRQAEKAAQDLTLLAKDLEGIITRYRLN